MAETLRRAALYGLVQFGPPIRVRESVARQLYVTGRYAEALACTMLFRGDLKEIRVHGGGVDNLHCLHLQGHVCWKLGYNKQSLNCLQEVIEKRNNNTLSKSVRGLNGSSNSNDSEPVGPTSFEDSWQLLVEMGLEVIDLPIYVHFYLFFVINRFV